MRFSVVLLFALVCLLACLDCAVSQDGIDIGSLDPDEYKLKDIETILKEAGINPKMAQARVAAISTAGWRAFIDAINTALGNLILSQVPPGK